MIASTVVRSDADGSVGQIGTVVHGLDVCSPLGFDPIETAETAMTASLDHDLGHDSLTGGRTRTKGLRMVCDDLEWPMVSAPALSGPGLDPVAART